MSRTPYDLCTAVHDYPAWRGPPRRSILICSQPRSGTTMLGEALYFAGGLGCPLEYIHFGFRSGFEARWGVSDTRQLIEAVHRHRTDPDGTVSIKIFWRDVAELAAELAPGVFPDLRKTPSTAVSPDTYRALADMVRGLFPNPVYVHLERRDRLRQAISSLTAMQSGIFRRIGASEDAMPPPPITYDFDMIGGMIAENAFCHAHWRALFAAADISAWAMTYENLVSDYADSVTALLDRLGHPGPVPTIRTERQSTAENEALMLRFLRDQRAGAPRGG